MRPDREAEHEDGEQRKRHHAVAEDRFSRLGRDDLGDDPEAGQDHDVDGRVRVEPEDVLVGDDVAVEGGIEEARAERAVEQHQELRAGDERRRDHDQKRGREVGPDQQRHAPERHPRRTHGDDRDQEVERGHDRGRARELDADREELLAERCVCRQRRVCRPAGVEGARRPGPGSSRSSSLPRPAATSS